jgi:hypothetical protein
VILPKSKFGAYFPLTLERNSVGWIRCIVREFLATLKLTMSQENTHITHACSQSARFLGYEIKTMSSTTKVSKNKNGDKVRYVNGRIALLMPHDVETKWVREYSRNGKPIHINQHMQYNDYEIIAAYGARLRGLAQYYLLAQNVSLRMDRVYWVGLTSLQKTLCWFCQSKSDPFDPQKMSHLGE